MTCLTLIQNAALEYGLSSPASIIGSTDVTTQQLLSLALREGKTLRNKFYWPELTKENVFTLTTSQANYALPTDFDEQVFHTHWDRTQRWELNGPFTPQEWQHVKSGIVSLSPRRRFRLKGLGDSKFFVDPTPAAGDNGATLVFEYQSKNWIRPRTWVTGVTYGAATYTFYNGNYYSTTAGGVTGATPPTHTSGSASDGTVTWIYYSGLYETFLADTDISNLDEEIITMGIIWRYGRAKGLDYETQYQEYFGHLNRRKVAIKGARILDMAGPRGRYPFLGPWNVPDTNYGS